MDWVDEEESPQREEEEGSKLSPEELRREMYRCLVSNNIITEEDLKVQIEEEPPTLETFVKATSYMLENHRRLFKLFDRNGAYYEAVKLARRLVKANVITQQEKPFHETPYYFDKNDKETMNSIDVKLKEWYPKNVIPTKHPFIRKIKLDPKPCLEIKVEEAPPSLDVKVEKDCAQVIKTTNYLVNEHSKKPKKEEKIRVNPGLITVSGYIRGKHRFLFSSLDEIGELDKAYRVSNFLAETGIVSKRDKKLLNTYLYFSIDDSATMDAIDNGINRYFTEDGRRRAKEKPLKPKPEPEFITVSKYLLKHHPELFTNSTTPGSTFAKANYIAILLAEEKVIPTNIESYHNTKLYFRRSDSDIMDRIDGAIHDGVLEN